MKLLLALALISCSTTHVVKDKAPKKHTPYGECRRHGGKPLECRGQK